MPNDIYDYDGTTKAYCYTRESDRYLFDNCSSAANTKSLCQLGVTCRFEV